MIGSYGGAEQFFVRLSAELAARGVEQLIIIINDNEDLVASVRAANLEHRVLTLSRFGSLFDTRTIAGHAATFRPDVIMAWMNRAARRIPRGPHVNAGRLGGYYPVKNYKRCSHLLANTPGIVEACLAEGWSANRVKLISNFSDDFSLPIARAPRDLNAPLRICALGRFDAWKGFDTLVDALRRPERAILRLAGKGEQEAALREQVARLGLDDRIAFLGWQDERAKLFAEADICVVPSKHEPLGNVILEAWSAGCPVIAAESEGPSWLIESERTGLLFEPGNVESLGAALDTAIRNPEACQLWAKAGRERWEKEFSVDVICRQYMNFFSEITQGLQAG
jgi:glycosyltransferase involved in cell wall biosynthesis